jgi:hypothetical protein
MAMLYQRELDLAGKVRFADGPIAGANFGGAVFYCCEKNEAAKNSEESGST